MNGEKLSAKEKYSDIIGLPHHQSEVHARMSMRDRAAQFAPFAALRGYSDRIENERRRNLLAEDWILEDDDAGFVLLGDNFEG